ncbi:MAG: hypothetical protein A2X04_16040 [Bacteroidetes bacterium GWF2_41_9]|nr:MAG: hypothetical protein A2X04_16040 [Bacteroidetes bacterium GWF2_41_9]HAM09982.1 hypothetical protein [Bacteroidales bacterium]
MPVFWKIPDINLNPKKINYCKSGIITFLLYIEVLYVNMSKMDNLFISPTQITPEIRLSVEENIFRVSGTSRPEDVRALYYPVIEWIKKLSENILNNTITVYNSENPLRFQIDLLYFNSSSAKFLFDIFTELNQISPSGVPVKVEWYYEKDDPDMLEAGNDMSTLAEMEFTYIPKETDQI